MSEKSPAAKPDTIAEVSDRLWTIPNILCFIRLGGSLVLLPVAWQGHNEVFLWAFLLLAMTDWFDGKLAILLNQRSIYGARLDSWADTALYAALLFGLLRLYHEVLLEEILWIGAALSSYAASIALGFMKYGRWPSYHTRAAKTSWFLTGCAVIALFLDWAVWPLRVAAAAITVTNLEALAISLISPAWQVDVTSVWHAWRNKSTQANKSD